MTNRLTVAIALAAGLAGGLMTRYIAPPPVFAQSQVTDEIRARNFTVVDEKGNAIGTLTSESYSPNSPRSFERIVVKDANGRNLQVFGGTMLRPLVAGQR